MSCKGRGAKRKESCGKRNKRISVQEVIRRAQYRIQEKSYHLTKNNCESFAMWCLCGLNITLQGTRRFRSSFFWENIESEKQRRLLQAREPIRRFSDIKAGDHLIRNGTFAGSIKYQHHFLCVGVDSKQKPQIIHYYKTRNQKIIVQKMTLPHKDFIENEGELQAKGKEVRRVVWPEELRHFSVLPWLGREKAGTATT